MIPMCIYTVANYKDNILDAAMISIIIKMNETITVLIIDFYKINVGISSKFNSIAT